MKQIQIVYKDAESFRSRVRAIRKQYAGKTALMQFFYDMALEGELQQITDILEEDYPECRYFGCSSNANVAYGEISEHTILAVCCIFEEPDTRIKVLQYRLTPETQAQLCDDLLMQVSLNPWVRGIEMLLTVRDMSLTYLCDRLSEMDVRIRIFGGCAFNTKVNRFHVSVFSDEEGLMQAGAVFVLLGGSRLHIESTYIHGWKPLGKQIPITRAEGNRLYELGGEPAFDTYYRYLQIENDESFYLNTLEFPISYERNGIPILRVPSDCMEDGSLIMSSDMTPGTKARLSYGDPQTILRSILQTAEQMAEFVPEGILLFTCASRRVFWGEHDINQESLPFQALANTAGFYTGGEFHRMEKLLNQHNVTMVIVGIREGEPGTSKRDELIRFFDYHDIQISMVRRLANFIEAATRELDETNKKLEMTNALLRRKAITDELTDVYNRREIQARIVNEAESGARFALIMLDLDLFKQINDTYGHEEGDRVLSTFAGVMKAESEMAGFLPSIGRWGGEEFMILLPAADAQDAFGLAERIRTTFSEVDFPTSGHHTVSCGVTVADETESADKVCSRVDKALYSSKNKGRNRTTIF